MEVVALNKWTKAHSILMILSFLFYCLNGKIWPVAIVAFVSYAVLILQFHKYIFGESNLPSRANMVTLLRHDLIGLLLIFFTFIPNFLIGLASTIIALLDLLDGHYARKDGNSTLIGAYLDKETDALFVFAMCLMIWDRELLPAWIMILGLLRYIYVLFLLPFLHNSNTKEHRSKFGQTVAVILMIGLIGTFIIPWSWYQHIMVGVVILGLTSFARGVFINF